MSGSCGKICLHDVVRFAARLRTRSAISVHGPDAESLLQGLVTADVRKLTAGSGGTLAAFLNSKGRLLFDVLLSRPQQDKFYVETGAKGVPDLISHLRKYKLRAKAEIRDLSSEMNIWSFTGFKKLEKLKELATAGRPGEERPVLFVDPRCSALGIRAILPRNWKPDLSQMNGALQLTERVYHVTRILHGICEGAQSSGGDFESTELPLECNLDLLGGVNFEKGCYLGQELTARTHHTGVVRKRFLPVVIAQDAETVKTKASIAQNFVPKEDRPLIPPGLIDYSADFTGLSGASLVDPDAGRAKASGEVRSSAYNLAMAHVRLENVFPTAPEAEEREQQPLGKVLQLENGMYAQVWRPHWFAPH